MSYNDLLLPHILWQSNWCNSLIRDSIRYYNEGHTAPIQPNKVFPANRAQDAFRYMQKGQHIGKISLSIPHTTLGEDALETTKRAVPIEFSPTASYLLVGGLGGLGRAIASWMVDSGARELLFLSRSAGTNSKDRVFVNELESMGCIVKMVQGDVTMIGDVEKAIAAASFPLKGVIQMSMVLRDQNFAAMTFEEWTSTLR